MKMLEAKAFWLVFRIIFFLQMEFLKQNQIKGWSSEGQKKVGKFEVKKVKNKGAVSKNVVRVAISPRSP